MSVRIDEGSCLRCGGCVGVCPSNCLVLDASLQRDESSCVGCGRCVRFCPVGALSG